MSSPEPQTIQSETVRKHKEFLFPAVATYYQEPLALVKGEGFHVWDDKGDKYLDCFGGVLTVSVGHANPRVNEAITNQINSIAHTSTLYANKPQSDLAEKLAQITPGRLKKSFFTNSGTEADDTAVHAAKLATGRHEIVVLRHAYSGRSATSLSAMGHAPWLLSYQDMASFHGNDGWVLPIPATFVVGRDGMVKARFVDPDFRKRMEIDDLVKAVRDAGRSA